MSSYEIKYLKHGHCKLGWLPVLWRWSGQRFPTEKSFQLLEGQGRRLGQYPNNLSIIVIFEYCYSRKLLVCKISISGITNCPRPPWKLIEHWIWNTFQRSLPRQTRYEACHLIVKGFDLLFVICTLLYHKRMAKIKISALTQFQLLCTSYVSDLGERHIEK